MGETSGEGAAPDNFEFFDLQIVCFVVFSGAKFNTLVTTKSYENDTINAWGTSACDKEKQTSVVIFSNFANER